MLTAYKILFLSILCIMFSGCDYDQKKITQGKIDMKSIETVSSEQWEKLAAKRIYFGHQSVGFNILDGIQSVMSSFPQIKLNIVETRDPDKINPGVFAHSRVGQNENPQSKTDDFVNAVNLGIGNRVNIAFHKYCYIDANEHTDIDKIFAHYFDKMKYLESNYTGTKFIHVTMPLTTIQTGPKAWVKKILGKTAGGLDANVKRNEFNKLLKENFRKTGAVFDLAAIEATRPDGKMTTFNKNNREYLSMHEGYTDDGGHLNDLGQKKVAEQLLIFLAKLEDV